MDNILNLGTNPVMKDDMYVYFEELMNFVYYDFAKENQFIQLNVNGEDYIYKIFSVDFLKVFDVNKFLRFETIVHKKQREKSRCFLC